MEPTIIPAKPGDTINGVFIMGGLFGALRIAADLYFAIRDPDGDAEAKQQHMNYVQAAAVLRSAQQFVPVAIKSLFDQPFQNASEEIADVGRGVCLISANEDMLERFRSPGKPQKPKHPLANVNVTDRAKLREAIVALSTGDDLPGAAKALDQGFEWASATVSQEDFWADLAEAMQMGKLPTAYRPEVHLTFLRDLYRRDAIEVLSDLPF